MSLDLAHYNDYWKIIRDLNKKFETNINDNIVNGSFNSRYCPRILPDRADKLYLYIIGENEVAYEYLDSWFENDSKIPIVKHNSFKANKKFLIQFRTKNLIFSTSSNATDMVYLKYLLLGLKHIESLQEIRVGAINDEIIENCILGSDNTIVKYNIV